MKELFAQIDAIRDAGDGWCPPQKSYALASLVFGLRARLVVEIGVWRGASLLPMLLALKHVRASAAGGNAHLDDARAIAIDPWARAASVAGMEGPHATWWGDVDHERAYRDFLERMGKAGVTELCAVLRCASDDALLTDPIDVLHVDGNHAEQAVRDALKFCPLVRAGGIAVFDDVSWEFSTGRHVSRAIDVARDLGFVPMYTVGDCLFTQRRRGGA